MPRKKSRIPAFQVNEKIFPVLLAENLLAILETFLLSKDIYKHCIYNPGVALADSQNHYSYAKRRLYKLS